MIGAKENIGTHAAVAANGIDDLKMPQRIIAFQTDDVFFFRF